MPIMQFANGLLQTLSVSAQTTTDTSFTPSTTAGFPAAPQFTLLNIRTGELVLVTAVGAAWTITRGYGGSAAAAFNAGDALQYSLTREMLLGGVMVKIDEVGPLTTTAASLTVTPPTAYAGLIRSLRAQFKVKGDVSAENTPLYMRFNGDAGANYDGDYQSSSSGTYSAADFTGANQFQIGYTSGATATAANPAQGTIDIIDYSSTTFRKTYTCVGMLTGTDTAGHHWFENSIGVWRNTAAITSITILPSSGNFIAGSVFTLYGVP